ncbi:MAG: hypothetical protein Q7R52_01375 [archaeon]|nr:hypothetical protein [archaeon]
MQERNNILLILEQTKEAMKSEDVAKLSELSNRTIHTASITQDPDNITIAVIVYSLSKIIERKKYQKYEEWNKFYNAYDSTIDRAIESVKQNNEVRLRKYIELLRKAIDSLSGDLKTYIQDVFRKASINKASRIYEHGISMEKTASLLGITMWELASYAGSQPGISDLDLSRTVDVKTRLKIASEMFQE